jgi:hypothetical protein
MIIRPKSPRALGWRWREQAVAYRRRQCPGAEAGQALTEFDPALFLPADKASLSDRDLLPNPNARRICQ